MGGVLGRYYYWWATTFVFRLTPEELGFGFSAEYIRLCVSSCGCQKSLGHNIILNSELQIAILCPTILSIFDSIYITEHFIMKIWRGKWHLQRLTQLLYTQTKPFLLLLWSYKHYTWKNVHKSNQSRQQSPSHWGNAPNVSWLQKHMQHLSLNGWLRMCASSPTMPWASPQHDTCHRVGPPCQTVGSSSRCEDRALSPLQPQPPLQWQGTGESLLWFTNKTDNVYKNIYSKEQYGINHFSEV